MSTESSTITLPKKISGVNLNTFIIIFGFAGLWYLSQVFVTKEIYYRDQIKLEATLKELKEGQNRVYDLLMQRNNKN